MPAVKPAQVIALLTVLCPLTRAQQPTIELHLLGDEFLRRETITATVVVRNRGPSPILLTTRRPLGRFSFKVRRGHEDHRMSVGPSDDILMGNGGSEVLLAPGEGVSFRVDLSSIPGLRMTPGSYKVRVCYESIDQTGNSWQGRVVSPYVRVRVGTRAFPPTVPVRKSESATSR